LAEELAADAGVHAMMDISDGLSLDLYRMCRASRCNAEIIHEQVDRAISDEAKAMALADHQSALDHALNDGEDFELLVCGDAVLGDRHAALRASVHRIH